MKNPESDRLYPDDWDDNFRQRFADFQSVPPADALARILANLPTPAPAINGRNTWLFGGLGTLLLLVGAWFVTHRASPIAARLMVASLKAQKSSETSAPERLNAKKRSTLTLANSKNTSTIKPTHLEITLASGVEATLETKQKLIASDKRETVLDQKPVVSAGTVPLARVRNMVEEAPPQQAIGQPQSAANYTLSVFKSDDNPATPVIDKPLALVENSGNSLPQLTGKQPGNLSTDSPVSAGGSQPVSLAFLTNQPLRPLRLSLPLPQLSMLALPQSTPQRPTINRQRPAVFVGIMPLYTYQRIDPIQNDEIWVKSITPQRTLSGQRAGIRLQAGVEWPLSQRISLRTSLIYNQLNQQINYTTPTNKPDSVRVEMVDARTVRVVPYYNDKQMSRQTNWHYVGVGADIVWHLGKLGSWQHHITAGASTGAYLSQNKGQTQPLSGFIQASYGIERQLTPSVWLRIAPTVQYGLTTISDSEGLFRIRPYTYGLTIGLRR